MKVAFVSYDFPEYCIRHVNEMVDEAEVLLMLPMELADGHFGLLDPRVRFEPFSRPRYREPIKQWRTAQRILNTVERFDPSVAHFQNGHLFFNFRLGQFRNYPFVLTVHDARQHPGDKESRRTPQWLMDYGFRQADQLIAHAQSAVDVLTKEVGISRDCITVMPHIAIGENASLISTEDTEISKTDRPDSIQEILFFGRIWGYKGLEYLIEAAPEIMSKVPDARIVIAGEGDDFQRYRDLMDDPAHFEVHNGWISDEFRAELFSRCAIVALPYIEASQSGVIPIAYNHRKPVVATTVGGLPDVVEHGKTGLLVPPADSSALAEAIVELLSDTDKQHAFGTAGFEKLHSESAPPIVAAQTMDVYRRTIRIKLASNEHDIAVRESEPALEDPLQRDLAAAARACCDFLRSHHVRSDGALFGPDPGVRFNYRIWRFLKNVRPRRDWGDGLVYQQAQGYWILANWTIAKRLRR